MYAAMKINFKINLIAALKIIVTIGLLGLSFNAFSQAIIKKAFTPRTSQLAPGSYQGKSIYNLQGDFNMIGNSNAKSATGPDNGYNMVFNKLVGDLLNTNIKNSSSADFVLPSNANLACTKIVFAGLYWTGRGDDNSGDILSKAGNAGNGMNKKNVKFKVPGAANYVDLTATDIFYGASDVSGMYTAFYDVTDLVSAAKTGTYSVANIATFEGSDGLTNPRIGYYAGWGLVVVYENAALPWRNITVFDGFGYVKGSSSSSNYGTLNVSGFQAVQNGNVNIKMGFMAGEGDRSVTGDYFSIQRRLTSSFTPLSHASNSTDNFFNSSIFTGGNNRVPNNVDNDGIDIAMFNLNNSDNVLINNNQTTTSFRYGSSGDYYNIFNITFAVDAYIPEVQVYNANESSVPNNGTVGPNQTIDFTSNIYNKGTEPITNGVVEIPLPHNVHYVSSNVTIGSGTSVVWSHPSGATDPNITPGGKLTWTVGNLIKPADPNTILAQLKYRIRVTNDCTILTTGGACGLVINLDGSFKGTGTNSGIAINNGFVIGYNPDCGNTPIRDPFQMNIVPSQAFIDNCPVGVNNGIKQFKAFCSSPGNAIPRSTITSAYPLGSKFYSVSPAVAGYESSLISGNFPLSNDGNATPYYAVLEGMTSGCFLKLETSLEKVTTQPIVNNLNWCSGSPVAFNNQLSPAGAANGNQLYYFNNANDTNPLSSVPNPTTAGTYNYFVAEGLTKNGTTCFGPKVPFRVDIYALPVITQDLADNFFVCADDEKTISLQSNAATVVWEYFNKTTSTWSSLTVNTFVNEVTPNGSAVKFTSPSIDRDQLKIRAKLSSANSCTIYSKEVSIEVRLCNIITNPMLPAKIIKN